MTPTTKKAPVVKLETPAPDRPPLWEMTDAQILEAFPKDYPKPVSAYTTQELIALKVYGPTTLGGELYLASQKAATGTNNGALGPAILSKGFKEIPFVTHVDGSQGDDVPPRAA